METDKNSQAKASSKENLFLKSNHSPSIESGVPKFTAPKPEPALSSASGPESNLNNEFPQSEANFTVTNVGSLIEKLK